MMKLILTFFGLLTLLSLKKNSIDYEILNESDLKLQIESFSKPYLTSALNAKDQWRSFNIWQCFNSNDIKVECIVDACKEKHIHPVLTISLTFPPKTFNIEYSDNWLCEDVKNKWEHIVLGNDSTCIFGAYLENDEIGRSEEYEHWYVEIIKNQTESWSTEDLYMDTNDEEDNDQKINYYGEVSEGLLRSEE